MTIDNTIDDYMVLDLQSGTMFCLANACLINVSKLSDDERDLFLEYGDSEAIDIGRQHGLAITPEAPLN
jgi:hypothetical protein